MNPSAIDHRRGSLYMLLVIVIWGGLPPAGKSALHMVDPYWITAMRFGFAACVFLALLWLREGRGAISTDGQLKKIALFGALGFAGFGITLFEGLRLTRPEIAAMILALGPIQVAIFQWWRSRRRPDNFTLAAIAFALLGEGLVLTAGDITRLSGGDALGNGLVFAASLFWTAYTLGGQQFPGWSPVRYTALSCSLGWIAIAMVLGIATLAGHSKPPQARTTAGRLAAADLHHPLRLGARDTHVEHGRCENRPAECRLVRQLCAGDHVSDRHRPGAPAGESRIDGCGDRAACPDRQQPPPKPQGRPTGPTRYAAI